MDGSGRTSTDSLVDPSEDVEHPPAPQQQPRGGGSTDTCGGGVV